MNDVIRFDNLVLTAPADSGGAGLSQGLSPVTDGIGLGLEVGWRISERLRLIGGVQRLADGSRKDFLYDHDSDPITPPVSAFLDYSVDAFPLYAGIGYGFALNPTLSYEITATLLYISSSTLGVRGSIGGPALLDESGTASGLGAAFGWGGRYEMGGPFAFTARVVLRLGRLGDVKDSDGDPITSAFGDVLGLDWSGVDLLVGLTWWVF